MHRGKVDISDLAVLEATEDEVMRQGLRPGTFSSLTVMQVQMKLVVHVLSSRELLTVFSFRSHHVPIEIADQLSQMWQSSDP